MINSEPDAPTLDYAKRFEAGNLILDMDSGNTPSKRTEVGLLCWLGYVLRMENGCLPYSTILTCLGSEAATWRSTDDLTVRYVMIYNELGYSKYLTFPYLGS